MTTSRIALLLIALTGSWVGCGHGRMFPGTSIPATEDNQAVLETVETYRQKVTARDVEGLLLLASQNYFEDGGTPQASDDYGYDGLRQILTNRLGRVSSIHYDIQYRSVRINGDRAEVDAYLNGAFELVSDVGERYRRINDMHRFVLERRQGNNQWRFISGM